MSEENILLLPEGWVWTTFGQCFEVHVGATPSRKEPKYWEGNIPWVSSGEVQFCRIQFTREHITQSGLRNSSTQMNPVGSVLLGMIGEGRTRGQVAILDIEACNNQNCAAIWVSRTPIVPEYVYYWLWFQYEVTRRGSSGNNQPALNKSRIEQMNFPLSPNAEQQRIVAAIEQQLSRLDAGVAALKHAKTKLKRYRAAVLKAAVEGKLTEAWRARYPTTEPASMLLERILKERRAKWEADLRAKGKDPAKVRYVEPAAPDMEGLPELAEGWCWASFTQISERVTVGHVGPMKDEYLDDGIPFLRGQNVRPNQFDPDGLKYISNEFHHLLAKSALEPGDILVVRSGAVGTACVMPDTYKEANCSDLVIVKRPIQVNPRYAVYYMNSTAQDRVRAKQVGIALTHFNTQSMAAMPLPLAPLAEQEQIVTEVERRLSVISQLETAVEANLKRAERLRQSILSEAFAGRLVPQDPNDEPASVLLERIRSERGSSERKNGTGVSKGNKGRSVKVPEHGVLDVMGTEQVELWEGVGG